MSPGQFLRSFSERMSEGHSPVIEAEQLRYFFRNAMATSFFGVFSAVFLYITAQQLPEGNFLLYWIMGHAAFHLLRTLVGLQYARRVDMTLKELFGWRMVTLAVLVGDSLLVAVLALKVYPVMSALDQLILVLVVLMLVGSTAYSLSGRWLEILIYATPVYLAFAWSSWFLEHYYAKQLAVMVIVFYALYLVHARSRHRSSEHSLDLLRRNAELARGNGELAQELQVKNDQLQEVATARSRLLATVSHDLRQPSHAIGLLCERALLESNSNSLRESLRDLNELSQSLSASLTTLMDLTRLDAGLVTVQTGPIRLAEVLLRLEAEFNGSARAKGLSLIVGSSESWVQSDPVLLHGILANLVSNAIKYTRAGGVELRVSERPGALRLEVIDTGIGIHPEKLDLIFKEFVRLDASDSGTEGLGLGLSIVRRYAGLLAHPLSVQSAPGQGSSFGIELPLTAAVPLEVQTGLNIDADAQEGLSGLRVLVVDNVDLLLQGMVRTLRGWGCQVEAAHNMHEALNVAGRVWPDLVVSDHHLGDREPNGIELIAVLRRQSDELGKPAPMALLMTGDVSAQLESQAREVGVRVMHKPVRPKALQRGLLDLLETARRSAAEIAQGSPVHG